MAQTRRPTRAHFSIGSTDQIANYAALALILVGGFWFWIGRISTTTAGLHSFRQTQTLFTVREFVEGNWSLASPMPVLGPPWQVPFELPLFQALSALGSLTFGLDFRTATQLVALFLFLSSAALLFAFVRNWCGNLAAIASLTLFLFSPFANQWSTAPLIESLPIVLILGALCLQQHQGWNSRKRTPVLTISSGLLSVAGAVKITTVLPWLPLVLILIAFNGKASMRLIATRWLAVLIPLFTVTFMWTRFADSVKAQNELTSALTSGELSTWNFGSLSQRLVVDNYVTVFERLSTLGGPGLVWLISALIVGVAYRWSLQVIALIGVPIFAVLGFFNLYVIHDYYLMAVAPSIAAVMGVAIAVVAHRLKDRRSGAGLTAAAVTVLLFLSYTSKDGLRLAEVWRTPGVEPALSKVIRDNTRVDDLIIVDGCDWNPTVLFFADRRGIAVPQWWNEPLPTDVIEGFTYLAACEDPYAPGSSPNVDLIPVGTRLEMDAPGLWRLDLLPGGLHESR